MLSKVAEEPKLPSWHVAEGFALAPLKINLQAEAKASASQKQRAVVRKPNRALFNIYIVARWLIIFSFIKCSVAEPPLASISANRFLA